MYWVKVTEIHKMKWNSYIILHKLRSFRGGGREWEERLLSVRHRKQYQSSSHRSVIFPLSDLKRVAYNLIADRRMHKKWNFLQQFQGWMYTFLTLPDSERRQSVLVQTTNSAKMGNDKTWVNYNITRLAKSGFRFKMAKYVSWNRT